MGEEYNEEVGQVGEIGGVGIGQEANLENGAGEEFVLPAKVTPWTRVKNILFYEIKLELTPYQQKVFKEVHDFWHQEITAEKIHNFLFQEISFGK